MLACIYSKLYSHYKGQCFSDTFKSMCSTISVEFISCLGAKFKTLYHILSGLYYEKFKKVLSNDSACYLTADHPDPILVYTEFQGCSRPNEF